MSRPPIYIKEYQFSLLTEKVTKFVKIQFGKVEMAYQKLNPGRTSKYIIYHHVDMIFQLRALMTAVLHLENRSYELSTNSDLWLGCATWCNRLTMDVIKVIHELKYYILKQPSSKQSLDHFRCKHFLVQIEKFSKSWELTKSRPDFINYVKTGESFTPGTYSTIHEDEILLEVCNELGIPFIPSNELPLLYKNLWDDAVKASRKVTKEFDITFDEDLFVYKMDHQLYEQKEKEYKEEILVLERLKLSLFDSGLQSKEHLEKLRGIDSEMHTMNKWITEEKEALERRNEEMESRHEQIMEKKVQWIMKMTEKEIRKDKKKAAKFK